MYLIINRTNLLFNPKYNQTFDILAINHGADYPYLEGVHIFDPYTFNKNDWNIRNVMLTTISSFIKTGYLIFLIM